MADTRIATHTMKAFVFKQIGEVDVVEKPIQRPLLFWFLSANVHFSGLSQA